MLEIEDDNFVLKLDTIKALEQTRDIVLPEDYKNFLLKHNGGRPKFMTAFDLNNGDSDSTIDTFLGIKHPEEIRSVEYILKTFGKRVPETLFPIARDPFGNLICISIRGKNYGKIYFWDHENEQMDPDKEPWWNNIYLIANSFTEFLDGLYQYDLDDEGNEIRTFQDGRVIVTPAK